MYLHPICIGKYPFIKKLKKHLPKFNFIDKITMQFGEYGEGVNTVDCGSIMLGFESLYSPHIVYKIDSYESIFI